MQKSEFDFSWTSPITTSAEVIPRLLSHPWIMFMTVNHYATQAHSGMGGNPQQDSEGRAGVPQWRPGPQHLGRVRSLRHGVIFFFRLHQFPALQWAQNVQGDQWTIPDSSVEDGFCWHNKFISVLVSPLCFVSASWNRFIASKWAIKCDTSPSGWPTGPAHPTEWKSIKTVQVRLSRAKCNSALIIWCLVTFEEAAIFHMIPIFPMTEILLHKCICAAKVSEKACIGLVAVHFGVMEDSSVQL